MDIERLKELKAEFEQMRKYNDRHCMSTATEDDVLDVLDEAEKTFEWEEEIKSTTSKTGGTNNEKDWLFDWEGPNESN